MIKEEQNKEIITIKGISYLKTDPSIVLDHFTEEYLHLNERSISKIIIDVKLVKSKSNSNFNPNDQSTLNQYRVISGYTRTLHVDNISEENKMILHSIYTGLIIIYADSNKQKEIISRLDLKLGINNNKIYYDKNEIEFMDKPKPYRKFDNTYGKVTIENVLNKIPTVEEARTPEVKTILKNIIKRNIDMGVESMTYKEFEGLRYTYGVELETCSGRLEEEEVELLNFKAVHDGSLREANGNSPMGGEYVTGVLVGDAGLSQLYQISRVLNSKCKVDKRCGVHVHIGSLNWNKEDVVFSYILAELVEKDIFETLPKSRRYNSYCRSLKKLTNIEFLTTLKSAKNSEEYNIAIDEMYDKIFFEVSGTNERASVSLNKLRNHPKGSKCGFDKSSQRYCWLNYVTLMFNTKGSSNSHTLEFRAMSGTLNYDKVKNWLKLCIGFCAFVENYKSLIKNHYNVPVNLELVLNKVYPKTGGKLIQYNRERKQVFMTEDESIDYSTDLKMPKRSMKEVVCA